MNAMHRPGLGLGKRFLFVLCGVLGAFSIANALPAFSIQTDQTCGRCHTSAFGPSLTQYGREFKANGYGQGDWNFVPLSGTAFGSFAHMTEDPPSPPIPELDNNDNAILNEASLYLASRISKNAGGYLSATYDRYTQRTRWGNVDLRFTMPLSFGEKRNVVAGLTINNNPTIQDLWNSAPARRYPYIDSMLLPKPLAAPVIEGYLGQQVIGGTVYGMLNGHYYVEAGLYRGVSQQWLDRLGMDPTQSIHVEGSIPYWRLAAARSFGPHHLSLGVMGLRLKRKPDYANPSIAEFDRYTDQGADATYEFIDRTNNSLSVNIAVVREHRNQEASVALGRAALKYNDLYTRRIDATYAYDQTMVGSAGWFDIKAKSDPTLWPAAPYTGSASGEPNTRGYNLQLEYIPFGKTTSPVYSHFNFRFGLRYTIYKRFNGGTLDYDGSGRGVRDNESILGFARVAF